MGTRIQDRSRPTKRPIGRADYSVGGLTTTITEGRIPRLDKRGYPAAPAGVGFPVDVLVTAVA